jgi:phage terminase large subunit
VVKANWRDKPWFPSVLEEERELDLAKYPDRYHHVWEGEYARAFEGAYFASVLSQARKEGRIGKVSADPILPLRAFWDIGGAGAKADAMALDCAMSGAGNSCPRPRRSSYYTNELQHCSYKKAICYLPHDGVNANVVTVRRFKDHLRDAEFQVEVIPNQGSGAAAMRIEAVRRIFPRCWFNEPTTEAGRGALGFYHEKKDEQRDVGLGPEHDWSSHAADAFGLMAIAYEEPSRLAAFNQPLDWSKFGRGIV